MIKIIIPLGGTSELFANAGYYYPKPLIEVNGNTMIETVLKNPQSINLKKQIIFIVKEDDCIKFHLDNTLKILSENCIIIKIKQDTQGGLCSVLLSVDYINDEDEILILNGDQIIDYSFSEILKFWKDHNADAGIIIFKSVHPRWSYAKILNEKVIETAEKNPISNNAIAGVYYFKNSKMFFSSAFSTIKNDIQVNGNYYISSVLNEYVLKNNVIIPFKINNTNYHSFYSPQVLQEYERKVTNGKI